MEFTQRRQFKNASVSELIHMQTTMGCVIGLPWTPPRVNAPS